MQKSPDSVFDVLIIGAGILGLATAYQLKEKHPDWNIALLEKETQVATHQTGRNSGVIHSGVYYKPGSLKAKNCLAGRQLLLTFCEKHQVPYKKVHKLIVATKPEELARLDTLFERGSTSKIPNIKLIDPSEIAQLEPHITALKALYIPDCHIIDYGLVSQKLSELLSSLKTPCFFSEKVLSIQEKEEECIVKTVSSSFRARQIINCSGLHSDRVYQSTSEKKALSHQIIPFRGEYYTLSPEKASLIRGLIYPAPDPNLPFLGIHLTPMMDGTVTAGPNAVLAFAREGYKKTNINLRDLQEYLAFPGFWKLIYKHFFSGCYELSRSFSKQLFLKDVQSLMPCITSKDLTPSYSGIRAQAVSKDGSLMDDFCLSQTKRTLHVLNAPSPAATASFSIAKTLINTLHYS